MFQLASGLNRNSRICLFKSKEGNTYDKEKRHRECGSSSDKSRSPDRFNVTTFFRKFG